MKPWLRRTSTVGSDGVRFRKAILALAASVAQRGGGPGADQAAGFQVVGREGRVGGIGRVKRRVERDDQQAGLAGLGSGPTMALVSDAAIRMPLAPSAMQLSTAATWLSWSPSTLPA
jgi:hypothetical protein